MTIKSSLVRICITALVGGVIASACSSADRAPWMEGLPEMPGEEIEPRGEASACEEEGVLRECSEKVGDRDGFVSCKRGIQECHDGVWGPCGRETITFVTRKAVESMPTSAISGPDPLARCTADPCNPACMAFDEKPVTPIASPFLPGFSYEGNPNEWGNAPEGFVKKQDCGNNGGAGGCWSGYSKDCSGDPTHFNRFDGCQADHHCDQSTNKCIRSAPGWTWPVSVCPGVDLTIGPSCQNDTNIGFPLCNRGNATLPTGTMIKLALRNGNNYDFSCPTITNGTTCNVKTTTPLQPGECMRVVRGPSCNWNGNTVAYVNSDKAVTECGPKQATSNPTQPGCSNNWSDVTTGAVCELYTEHQYEPSVITEEYKAVCPNGTRPTWGLLVFEAVTPCSPGACNGTNASSVKFEMQTAPASNPSAFTGWTTVAHAPSPPYSHPSSCRSDAGSPCPVRLRTSLEEPEYELLRLRVTLAPSPDGQAGSSLSNWQITYDCPPNE